MSNFSAVEFEGDLYFALLRDKTFIDIYKNGERLNTIESKISPFKAIQFFVPSDINDFFLTYLLDGAFTIYSPKTERVLHSTKCLANTFHILYHKDEMYIALAYNEYFKVLKMKDHTIILEKKHALSSVSLTTHEDKLVVFGIAKSTQSIVRCINDSGQISKTQVKSLDTFQYKNEQYIITDSLTGTKALLQGTVYKHEYYFPTTHVTTIQNGQFAQFCFLDADKNTFMLYNTSHKVYEGSLNRSFNIKNVQEKLKFEKLLGKGTYGTVHKSRFFTKEVAVKVFKKEPYKDETRAEALRNAQAEAHTEIDFYSCFRHPNIIKLLAVNTSISPVRSLVLEYAPMGSLASYIDNLSFNDRWTAHYNNILLDIISGIAYLHSHQRALIDLKPSNIVLTINGRAKLIDFGYSAAIRPGADYIVHSAGTKCYAAPEAHNSKYYLSSDIFSFGYLIYEIGCHIFPWAGYEVKHHIDLVKKGSRKCPMPYYPRRIFEMTMDCYQHDPTKRPTASNLAKRLAQCVDDRLISEPHKNTGYESVIDIFEYNKNKESYLRKYAPGVTKEKPAALVTKKKNLTISLPKTEKNQTHKELKSQKNSECKKIESKPEKFKSHSYFLRPRKPHQLYNSRQHKRQKFHNFKK